MLIFCVTLFIVSAIGCAGKSRIQVALDKSSGQYLVCDGQKSVLQYNYATVKPAADYLEKVQSNNKKYALARSNYIHPLFGPEGEQLTLDWSQDHPHHRGIYWAWPEVSYQGKIYDLHALQHVFARPTGKIEIRDSKDFTQIRAQNRWLWDDKTPVVTETALIKVWTENENGRYVDLTCTFEPLVEGITLARRGTNLYGGLNIRLSPIREMKLNHHVDSTGADERVAWQSATGIWKDATKPAVWAVFEKKTNPDYPGDYVEYPDLPWFQPTFPSGGTRFELKKGKPLILKYRLWIHSGDAPTEQEYRKQWNLFQKTK